MDEGKKWAKGKYPSASAGSIRINAKIANHRGNSTVSSSLFRTVPCFQHSLLGIEALYKAIQIFYWLYIHALLLADVILDEVNFDPWS